MRIVSCKEGQYMSEYCDSSRAVARSENPGGLVVLGGDNVSPLVERGLTDPPKSGGAAAPPDSHLAACLSLPKCIRELFSYVTSSLLLS